MSGKSAQAATFVVAGIFALTAAQRRLTAKGERL